VKERKEREKLPKEERENGYKERKRKTRRY